MAYSKFIPNYINLLFKQILKYIFLKRFTTKFLRAALGSAELLWHQRH